MDTISLPISFRNGGLELIQEGTDEFYAFLLSMAIQTEPGELPLTPDFGCYSPIFDDEQISSLSANASEFVPEIEIDDVDIVVSDSGKTDIVIAFSRVEE